VGSISDLVRPGHNGVLTPAGDHEAFADALTNILSDRALAERLAAGAAHDAPEHRLTAERHADAVAVAAIVERALA